MPFLAVGSDEFERREWEATVYARIGSVEEIASVVVAPEQRLHG
jgi:hypothetical protein